MPCGTWRVRAHAVVGPYFGPCCVLAHTVDGLCCVPDHEAVVSLRQVDMEGSIGGQLSTFDGAVSAVTIAAEVGIATAAGFGAGRADAGRTQAYGGLPGRI